LIARTVRNNNKQLEINILINSLNDEEKNALWNNILVKILDYKKNNDIFNINAYS
jgi:hypothetical protein